MTAPVLAVDGVPHTAVDGLILGRAPTAHVQVDNPTVSRHHAQVCERDGRWFLVDLDSSNGVHGSNGRTARVELTAHVEVRLGDPASGTTVAVTPPVLTVRNLTAHARRVGPILDDVSFSVPAGAMVALVGPSGAGKSTLLAAIADRGPGVVGHVALAPAAAGRRPVALVPQSDDLHELITVEHALTAAARLRLPPRTGRAEIRRVVDSTLAALGLGAHARTRIDRLSGGQRKRVSLGYELVGAPQLLLLDEPTSGLDPALERETMLVLRRLADRGTSVLVTTHTVQSLALCDLVIVLAPGGATAFVGPPDKVPAHFGVARTSDIFRQLIDVEAEIWRTRFGATSSYRAHVPQATTMQPRTSSPRPRRSPLLDLRVLLGRYCRSIAADRRTVALLALQAPALGLLLSLALDQRAFSPSLTPNIATRSYLAATVLAMTWLGGSNAIREIVRERAVFRREQAVGVRPWALVASRLLVLGTLTALQATALHLLASHRMHRRPGAGALLARADVEVVLALVIAGLGALAVGLAVSGWARSQAKAVSGLPLALVPLVLLSGVVLPTDAGSTLDVASRAAPSQWASSVGASATRMLAREGCGAVGLEAELQRAFVGSVIRCDHPRWAFDASTQAANLTWGAASVTTLVVVAFAATAWSMRRLPAR